jgi:hypothetical protein
MAFISVLIRDRALLKSNQYAGAAASTEAHGVFSFRPTKGNQYRLSGLCMLVENPAVFAVAERLNIKVDAVIYGYGRISGRILDWIARTADSDFSLLHLPDYDPVGLSEFEHIHSRLEKRAKLYLPSDLEARFERFSNQDFLKKRNSQAILAQLHKSELSEIRHVVTLIDRHNAGLE